MLLKILMIIIFTSSLLLSCTISDNSPLLLLIPEGERVKISLSEGKDVLGELLSVTETTIYIDNQQHIYAIPINIVREVLVEKYDINFKKEMHGKLKYFSRYPQGLSESQWGILLAHYQQKKPSVNFNLIN